MAKTIYGLATSVDDTYGHALMIPFMHWNHRVENKTVDDIYMC